MASSFAFMHSARVCPAATLLFLAASGFCQAPPWQWAHALPAEQGAGSATMDADGNNYYLIRAFAAEVATPCGTALSFPSGSGHYVMATDWQNTCAWTLPVPADLGHLYIGAAGELRFKGWFEQPLQFADTLFGLEPGAMLVDGAIDPVVGLHDGQVQSRARYVLYGPEGSGNSLARAVDHQSHAVLAVSLLDSILLGDAMLVAQEPCLILALMDEQGALLDTTHVAAGEVDVTSFDMDALGNVYIAGRCPSCVVNGVQIDGAQYSIGVAPFLARIAQPGGLNWTVQPEPFFTDLSVGVRVAGPNRVVVPSVSMSSGWPPGNVIYQSEIVQLDSLGAELHAAVSVAASGIGAYAPIVRIDAERNVVLSVYYVGSNPDQRIMSIDSVGNELWSVDLNQGGNLFGLAVHPVDTMTYLVTGWSEGGQTLGAHVVSPPPNNQFRVYFTAKLADFNVETPGIARKWEGISAWPNPAADLLRLDLPSATRIRILDAQGRIVIETSGVAGTNTINTSALAPGPYTIAADHLVARFIKE